MKYLTFFFIIVLFTGCSFDNKSGIWTGSKNEKKRIAELEEQQKRIEVVKIYSSEKVYSTEVPPLKANKLSSPIKNSSWEMSGLNLQNNIGNIYLSGINHNFLKKKIGKNKFSILKVKSSPLIYENNIFFVDDTGTIFRISQRGKIIWKKNIYKKIYKKIYKNLSLTINKNKIYVADNIGFIYSISLDTGELLWIKNHGVPIKSNIKIFKNKMFMMNQDNRILSFDLERANKIWDIRSGKSFIKSQNLLSLAISKIGDLYALNSSGDLFKIKAESGEIYWTLNVATFTFTQDTDFFKSTDIVVGENEVIFSSLSSIFSFNLSNGYLNWRIDVGSSDSPIIDDRNVFVISDNGYFINIDRKTGKIIWSVNILEVLKKKKQNTQITGFIMGSDNIYATTLNGYLIVCSALSGKVESFKKIGSPLISGPIISNGSMYILTQNNRILGYR